MKSAQALCKAILKATNLPAEIKAEYSIAMHVLERLSACPQLRVERASDVEGLNFRPLIAAEYLQKFNIEECTG